MRPMQVVGWVANRADAWPTADDINDIIGGTDDDLGALINPSYGKESYLLLSDE